MSYEVSLIALQTQLMGTMVSESVMETAPIAINFTSVYDYASWEVERKISSVDGSFKSNDLPLVEFLKIKNATDFPGAKLQFSVNLMAML
jgi:hypothetical protein